MLLKRLKKTSLTAKRVVNNKMGPDSGPWPWLSRAAGMVSKGTHLKLPAIL